MPRLTDALDLLSHLTPLHRDRLAGLFAVGEAQLSLYPHPLNTRLQALAIDLPGRIADAIALHLNTTFYCDLPLPLVSQPLLPGLVPQEPVIGAFVAQADKAVTLYLTFSPDKADDFIAMLAAPKMAEILHQYSELLADPFAPVPLESGSSPASTSIQPARKWWMPPATPQQRKKPFWLSPQV